VARRRGSAYGVATRLDSRDPSIRVEFAV